MNRINGASLYIERITNLLCVHWGEGEGEVFFPSKWEKFYPNNVMTFLWPLSGKWINCYLILWTQNCRIAVEQADHLAWHYISCLLFFKAISCNLSLTTFVLGSITLSRLSSFWFLFLFFPLNSRLLYFTQLWNVCPTNHPRLRLQHSANKIPRKKQLLRSNGIRLRGEHNCLMLVTELISASDICRCIKPVVQWNSKSMVLNIKQRRMVLFLFTSIYQSCRV